MSRCVAIFLTIAAVILQSSAAVAATFTPPARGTVYTGSLDVAVDKKIPLPPGEWILVGYEMRKNNSRVPFFRPQLIQVKGNVVTGLIEANVQADAGNSVGNWGDGYVLNQSCYKANTIHQKMIANGENREQDCWGVNHFLMTNDGKDLDVNERYEYIKKHNLILPVNMIKVGFHFAFKQPNFLDVSYGFNPEAEGFGPPTNAGWAESDWHKDRYYADPKKVEFINKLISWGEATHDRVKEGFLGKLNVANQIPSPFAAVATAPAASAPAAASNAAPLNIEGRMKEAEGLFQKKLITQEEYDKKRKEILSGL